MSQNTEIGKMGPGGGGPNNDQVIGTPEVRIMTVFITHRFSKDNRGQRKLRLIKRRPQASNLHNFCCLNVFEQDYPSDSMKNR